MASRHSIKNRNTKKTKSTKAKIRKGSSMYSGTLLIILSIPTFP
jgi:hypothetical protein